MGGEENEQCPPQVLLAAGCGLWYDYCQGHQQCYHLKSRAAEFVMVLFGLAQMRTDPQ